MTEHKATSLSSSSSSSSSSTASSAALLPHTTDRFNGITVSAHDLAVYFNKMDRHLLAFESSVIYSLQEWTRAGKRGLWINVPGACSSLIEVLMKYGTLIIHLLLLLFSFLIRVLSIEFTYHHAHGIEATLVVWLPDHREKFLTLFDTWSGTATITTRSSKSRSRGGSGSNIPLPPIIIPAGGHRRASSINPLMTRWALPDDASFVLREGNRVMSRAAGGPSRFGTITMLLSLPLLFHSFSVYPWQSIVHG
jgi:hypothetical protein